MNAPSIPQLPPYEDCTASPCFSPSFDQFAIVPSIASSNDRYSRKYFVESQSFTISPRSRQQLLETHLRLPDGWRQEIHPEGAPIFSNESLHAVTDNNIRDLDVLARLESCVYAILFSVKQSETELPARWQICVSLDHDNSSCHYYLVDHTKKTLFWPEDVDTSDISLPDASSPLQLDTALNEQYWLHAEFFPIDIPDIVAATEQVANFLTFGRSDQLTSDSSTFPYDATQCGNFLDTIRTSRHEGTHWTWFIARLSSVIARHKFDTFFGEPYARISREQRRLGEREVKKSAILGALDLALFRGASSLVDRMETLHVDGIVYTVHWRRFISARLSDWRDSSLFSTGILIATFGGLIYVSEGPSHYAGLISAGISVSGMLSGALLLQRYSGSQEQHATEVIDHLQDLDHDSFGYLPSAMLLSLPRALQMWALVALLIQVVLIAIPSYVLVPTGVAVALAAVTFAVISAVCFTLVHIWRASTHIRRSFSADHDSKLYAEVSLA